jgi:hypothetical protein
MKILLALFLTISSLNAHSNSCPLDFSERDLCAEVKWVSGPNLNKPSHFNLVFWKNGDSSQNPAVVNDQLKVYTWMMMSNGHNHGGPKITLTPLSDGIYEVRDARFFMHGMEGYWEVRVELQDGDGNKIVRASRVVF